MDIKGIGNNNYGSYNELYKKQETDSQTTTNSSTDKIEISQEAKLLQSSGASQEDVSKIREKIDSGFYNQTEVISKVADNILKEIAPESN